MPAWIKASETSPTETIIKVPIKILWENGFTYSLGSYNADDDDWWELPNNAIIPDEQIEYLSESLSSSPSGSREGQEYGSKTPKEFLDTSRSPVQAMIDYAHQEVMNHSLRNTGRAVHPVYRGWDSIKLIGRSEERFKELTHKGWDWSSFYNGWLEGRSDALGIMKEEYDAAHASSPSIGIGQVGDEMPEEIKLWAESQTQGLSYHSKELVLSGMKVLWGKIGQQLTSCQAARDEAMNDANVYKELYAKAQKDIASLTEQLGKVMEERDAFRSVLFDIDNDNDDDSHILSQPVMKHLRETLDKYPKQ